MNTAETKEDVLFSEYKKSFKRYAEFFGVKNYEMFFLIDKDDAGRGRRVGNSKISVPATHSVIRFLENELYPKIRR